MIAKKKQVNNQLLSIRGRLHEHDKNRGYYARNLRIHMKNMSISAFNFKYVVSEYIRPILL